MTRRKPRARSVIAFSVSYERDELLARGLGLEHLKELVQRLARPIVVEGHRLAYAGAWNERDDNFTYVFLRLISAEQDDGVEEGESESGAPRTIEPLINHLAWPDYLAVTPRIEARWINTCRILRIGQIDAGLTDICPDDEAPFESDRAVFNGAVTLSAMRAFQTNGMMLPSIAARPAETLPGLAARIVLGGKLAGSRGFAPGVFEESLLMLEAKRPLYVLGGFGGAAASFAEAFLEPARASTTFDAAAIERRTPVVARLKSIRQRRQLPNGMRGTTELLDALRNQAAQAASAGLAATFHTGLSDEQTRELMTTTDIDVAVRLVMLGLRQLPPTS